MCYMGITGTSREENEEGTKMSWRDNCHPDTKRGRKITRYHGSRELKEPIDKFKRKGKSYVSFGPLLADFEVKRHGIFFTNKESFAKQFGIVHKYEIRVKNTIILTDYIKDKFADSIGAWSKDREMWIRVKYGRKNWGMFDGELGERFIKWLIEKGYDSVEFEEYADIEGKREMSAITTVVFDPCRINPKGSI